MTLYFAELETEKRLEESVKGYIHNKEDATHETL